MQNYTSRHGRLFYCLISVVLTLGIARAQAPARTTINDVVYRADGTPAAGQLVITWPAFTTADNKPVAAGEKTIALGPGGAINVQLAPNEGATPAGSYYKVVYKLTNGINSSTTATEYWTVPAASPPGLNVTVGAIRAAVVAAQVAAQFVTRQYVDAQTAAILHVQPDSGTSNNFVTGITSAGVITKAQPAFANLSGSATAAQGGTGQAAYTKGDLLVAADASSLNKVAVGSDGQVLAADSSTVTGVKWTNPVAGTLVDYQKSAATVTGDGTDKTLYTFTLPAGALASGKGLRVFVETHHSAGAGSIVYKLWFGSTVIASLNSTSMDLVRAGVYVFNDPGSTASQQSTVFDLIVGSVPVSTPTAPVTSAENTASNAVVIKVTFSGPATDQVTPKMWLVEAVR
jgi:hypothetical protein